MGVWVVAPGGPGSRTATPAGQPPSGSGRPSAGAASVVSAAGSCSPGCLSVLAHCYSYTPQGWEPCFHCLGERPAAPPGAKGAQGRARGLGSLETFVLGPSSSLRPCFPVPRGTPAASPLCPPGVPWLRSLGTSGAQPSRDGRFPSLGLGSAKTSPARGTRWAAGSLGRDPSPAAARGRNGHAGTSQAPAQPRELCRAPRPSLLCTSGSPVPNGTSPPWLTDPPLPSGPRPSFCKGTSRAGPHVSPATGMPGLHVHAAV